ncbi:MAG: hypothetical protein KKC14_02915 [Alphaproteobacteria bacterium]|nr:hypothetical protein [Alphaproteobacteria bacterium]
MHTDELAKARRKQLESNGLFSPLIAEIAEALIELDGAAPRTLVINHVARRRGATQASEALMRELTLVLELHCVRAEREGRQAAFVSGPKTWALTADAFAFFRKHMRSVAGG